MKGTEGDFHRMQVELSEADKQAERRQQLRRRIRLLQMGGFVLGLLLFITVIVVVAVGQKTKVTNSECADGLECLPVSKCEGHVNQDFVYACGDSATNKICCLGKSNSSRMEKLPLLPKKCGIAPIGTKISNGVNASIGEFPWMALLGYTSPDSQFVQYLCGGTVINSRYILTAAHCTTNKMMHLNSVTLGELNIETSPDCEFDGVTYDCADPPVHINIESVIRHPQFSDVNLKNDIALLRLQQNITKYTDFIQPICLPFDLATDARFLRSKNFTISGWGKTSSSDIGVTSVLQRARVRAAEPDWCDSVLPPKVRPLGQYQFCALGTVSNQEACQGDSGGPITMLDTNTSDPIYYQIGVVSYKPQENCGVEPQPTVFTRIDVYLDWILDNLEP